MSYVRNDADRGPSRFGILADTAKKLSYHGDIKQLTPEEAVAFCRKMWENSGASGLSGPLNLIHFDTCVNSPDAAIRLLKRSDVNANAYLSMRETRYPTLAQKDPSRFQKCLQGWKNRIASLRGILARDHAVRDRPQTASALAGPEAPSSSRSKAGKASYRITIKA